MTDIEKQEKYRKFVYLKNWIKANLDIIFFYAYDVQFSNDDVICVRFNSNVFNKLNNNCSRLKFRFYDNPNLQEFNVFVSYNND